MRNKKVTIFGMGVSGLSALKLLHREGADITVVNNGEVNTWNHLDEILKYTDKCISQDMAKEAFESCELIILSPGIPKNHNLLKDSKAPIWSEIELGFRYADAPIIAITGTNGKTTTVTLLGEILKSMGYSTFVGGNIGVPLCDYKSADFIVLEVSSFQMEAIEKFKPHLAVILNVTQNHGERYDHFSDYLSAKLNIAKNLDKKDFMYTSDVPFEGAGIKIDLENIKMDWDLSKFKIPGTHNIKNLYVIYEILKKLNLDLKEAEKALPNLSGVPFRMELIEGNHHQVFNDAKSTNWDATLTAINSIKNKNTYLILGGQKRGHGDSILPHLEEIKKNVSRVFLIGETTDDLAAEINDNNFALKCYELKDALIEAKKESKGALIFSPAFPSFDQFKNYVDRGESFSKLVISEL
jgi:UDP-N-acetylmuramoylalanine--D-glutamate ligase